MKRVLALAVLLPFMMAAGDDCSSGCSGSTDPDCKKTNTGSGGTNPAFDVSGTWYMFNTRLFFDSHKWQIQLSMSDDGTITGTRVAGERCETGQCFSLLETVPITGSMGSNDGTLAGGITLTSKFQFDLADEVTLQGLARSQSCFAWVGSRFTGKLYRAAPWWPGDPTPVQVGC